MKRNVLIVLAIVALACVAFVQNKSGLEAKALPTETGPQKDMLAPSFSLKGLDGETYNVGGRNDKVLMLNFWASWCSPCQAEAPDLKYLYEKYKDQFDLYSVNVTKYDKPDKAKAFVDEYGLTNPILMDENGDVYQTYRGIAFPTNFLIDKNGVVREVIVGIKPVKELERIVQKLIKE